MLQFGDKRPSMEDIDDALAWESNKGSKRVPGQMKQYTSLQQGGHDRPAAPACFAQHVHWTGACKLQTPVAPPIAAASRLPTCHQHVPMTSRSPGS